MLYSPGDEQGFALPLTVFVLAVITLLLTAAFTKGQADRRIADASGATVGAQAIAKSGLQNYLGTTVSRPPDPDSVRINVTGGYADVVARVVRRPADTLANWLYIVRSTGHVIDPTQGKDPQAVRTIAQFAQWQTGQFLVRAALTAVDGMNRPSASDSVIIRGLDACGADTARYGLESKSLPGSLHGQTVITGKGAAPSAWTSWSAPTIIDSTHIGWDQLVNGGFAADYTSYRAGDNTYSSQVVTGVNLTVSDLNGAGLLIVEKNLILTGNSATWKGIILVGDKLEFNTNNNAAGTVINGAVVAGLNVGGNAVDFHNGDVRVFYNSCEVATTMARLTGFAPIANGWVDNWATY